MCGMDLDGVEAGSLGTVGGIGKGPDEFRNLGGVQFSRRGIARECIGGGTGLPDTEL